MPIDVAGVKKLLPPDSDFEKVVWDEQNKVVEFHWSNRNLVTPYTMNDWPLSDLQEGKTPSTVKSKPVVIVAPVATEPKPVDAKPKRGVRRMQ